MPHVWPVPGKDQVLVYNGPAPTDRPILSIPNYCKWYAFCLVHPNGTVAEVDYEDYEPVESSNWVPPIGVDPDAYDDLRYPKQFHCWADHVPNPAQLERVAAQLGAVWCEQSREMIIGRYQQEIAR